MTGMRRVMLLLASLVLAVPALAADISGKWTATFDTQMGTQNYTYTFKVDGAKLTGMAEGQFGKSEIKEGEVKGTAVFFVEMLEVQGMTIKVEYKGKIAGDEIQFTRQVGEYATEELVAKRAK